MTVEELFGPGDPGDPVLAQPVAAVSGPGSRVALATVGDTFVALPLHADTAGPGWVSAAAGWRWLAAGRRVRPEGREPWNLVPVRPIGPPRPTLVVAGCDPALPLLETPLALLDPPVAFAWWPCGSGEALRLAAAGWCTPRACTSPAVRPGVGTRQPAGHRISRRRRGGRVRRLA